MKKDYQEIDLRRPGVEKSKFKNEKATQVLVKKLIKKLKKKRLFLGIIESCTGGGLVNAITNISHASEVLKGALVTYSNKEKIAQGVPKSLIKKYSACSPQVALSMARQARKKISQANIGIGITGTFSRIDPTNPKAPIRTVFGAVIFKNKILIRKFYLPKISRPEAKILVIKKVLEILYQCIA